MNIEAGGLIINLNLLYLNEFKSAFKYQTNKEAMFFLNTISILPKLDNMIKLKHTKYYDIYRNDDYLVQLQYLNEKLVGYIIYKDRIIDIYLCEQSFDIEYLLSQYAFVYWLKNYKKCLFIHSSAISYNNNGILFCAKSGTGKSTQRRLWERNFNAICINDDKNILELKDDGIYIVSNPWSGKHFVCNNISVKLKVIVFLSQALENKAINIDKLQAFNHLLGQILLPSKETKGIWNACVDEILDKELIKFGCTPDDSAAKYLYDYLVKRGAINEN